MNKKELWLKIKSYHFEHIVPVNLWGHITEVFGGTNASAKAFATKIARKHNLNNRFALNAVSEYKKFVYLGIVSDFNVTPSKIIDIVWHEHLLFSKAYREFCSTIIEYTFDHNPELMPMTDQTGQFSAQYLDTLALYKTEFGIEPPADIWNITKYDKEKIGSDNYRSRQKNKNSMSPDGVNSYSNDSPLFTYFGNSDNGNELYPEFSGFEGGDSGGAGASGDWNDANSSNDGGDSGSGCSGGCGGGD
jgi:hypothetical protein